jgi:hypothetical protein
MRISVERGDPGYCSIRGARVYLNGIQLSHVRTADEDQKLVVLDVQNLWGQWQTETWYGNVRIALTDALRAKLRDARRL